VLAFDRLGQGGEWYAREYEPNSAIAPDHTSADRR
jgi:hypothetical protein